MKKTVGKSSVTKTPEGFSHWDSVELLKTEQDLQLYLNACFEEDPGDGSLIRAALGDIARARGMTELARQTGLARESLYKALSANGNPEFSTVIKVMHALGLRLNSQVLASASAH